MTRTRLALQTGGIILASIVIGASSGWAFGVALYNATFDPNDTSMFSNFWQALAAFFLGLACGFTIYVVASMLLLQKTVPSEMRTRGLRARVVLTPLLLAGCEIVNNYVAGIGGSSWAVWWVQQAVMLAACIAIAVPFFTQRTIAMIVGGAVATLVVLSIISASMERAEYRDEYADDVARWNGPLVLVDGNTMALDDKSWKPLAAEVAYSNEGYSPTRLQWRQYGPGDAEQNLSVEMYNMPIEDDVCRYETSCTFMAASNLGPVYQPNYMTGYYVNVPHGHIEVSDNGYDHDPIAFIDSLQLVDAPTFVNATKQLQ